MTTMLIARLRERANDPRLATDQASRAPVIARSVVDEAAIARAETILGRPLPPLLRDVYRQVGNGGFGPGYGLLPLLPDPSSGEDASVVRVYAECAAGDPEDAAWRWPVDLVPFCEWGCAIRTCVDCSTPDGTIITFDPNARRAGEPMSNALAATHSTLEVWFADWLAGVKIADQMFEPDPSGAVVGINPFTKGPLVFKRTKLRRGGPIE